MSIPDDTRLRIMRLIETRPEITQRELARSLNISLGKTNYCLKALIEKGLVKAGDFQRSKNKTSYLYILTPMGVKEKIDLTQEFLRHKMKEYDQLCIEIDLLRKELDQVAATQEQSE